MFWGQFFSINCEANKKKQLCHLNPRLCAHIAENKVAHSFVVIVCSISWQNCELFGCSQTINIETVYYINSDAARKALSVFTRYFSFSNYLNLMSRINIIWKKCSILISCWAHVNGNSYNRRRINEKWLRVLDIHQN